LIIRSSVDLPAPDRPITPTKPPGAIEKDALSTAAFVPKRHVKPSTTSMQCSRRVAGITASLWFRQLCDSRVMAPSPSTSETASFICHDTVIKPVDDVKTL